MAHHALIIGLSEAKDRNLQPLRYGCADAEGMHATLADELGYGKHARLLLQPNLSKVRQALDEIGSQVHAGDTFVLYFAGHGAQHEHEQYLLLHEASLVELERGDIAGNDLLALGGLMRRVAHDWPPVHAAYVLDACRTPLRKGARTGTYSAHVQGLLAGIVAREFLWLRAKPGAADAPSGKGASRPLVMNACGDGEQAYELEALGRGQFSHGLEQWLRTGKTQGQARVLGVQAVQEIAVLVDNTARQHKGRHGQRPWLIPESDEVLLWRPTQTPQGQTHAGGQGRTSGPTGGPTQELSELLLRFEQQLAAGRWRAPAWDCCAGTLALLHRVGLGEAKLTIYQQRMYQAERTGKASLRAESAFASRPGATAAKIVQPVPPAQAPAPQQPTTATIKRIALSQMPVTTSGGPMDILASWMINAVAAVIIIVGAIWAYQAVTGEEPGTSSKPRQLKNLTNEVGGSDPFHIRVGEVLEMQVPAPPMNSGFAGSARCPMTAAGVEGFQVIRVSGNWVRFRLSESTVAGLVAANADQVQGALRYLHLKPGQSCPRNQIALP